MQWKSWQILAAVIGLCAHGAVAQRAAAEETSWQLKLVQCHNKTDGVQDKTDEIYVIVIADDGKKHWQVPGAGKGTKGQGFWDIEEGGGNKRLNPEVDLWRGELKQGQSIKLRIIFMEKDQSPSEDVVKAVDAIAKKLRDGESDLGKVIGTLLQVLNALALGKNEDDYLGSVTVVLTRAGKDIDVKTEPNQGPDARKGVDNGTVGKDTLKLDWDEKEEKPWPGVHLTLTGSGAKFEVWMRAVTPAPVRNK